MKTVFRIVSESENLFPNEQVSQLPYTQNRAEEANLAFDSAVRNVLRGWINRSIASGMFTETVDNLEEFIEQGALRSFFACHQDALEQLLDESPIAYHLLRPIDEVYLMGDAYEPMFSRFESRIYNLAAQRTEGLVPFRYSSASRRGEFGDTIVPNDPARREDIGMYFGTRRCDEPALELMASQLRREALLTTSLPIRVVTEGYMLESLLAVKHTTAQLASVGDWRPQCFVIQRRHAHDDRHLGAALLVMDPQCPETPRRVVFCDTLKPSGKPPWWNKFKHKLDTVFPQPEGLPPVSARLEDGGVNLQRLHDGVPIRHQDIDCAFYTASLCRAMIQIARLQPELILSGTIEALMSEMTGRMPEYFSAPDEAKAPEMVREHNIVRRWNAGRDVLTNRMRTRVIDLVASTQPIAELA